MSGGRGAARGAARDGSRDGSRDVARGTARDADRFGEAYFARWYHDLRHRVKSATEVARQVDFVLHAAEWVLQRRVRTVLDVGCGEGAWGVALRTRRPSVRYTGVDPSAYAVSRYGARRGLVQGAADALDDVLPAEATYDLVLAVGMLNYLPFDVLGRAVRQMARRTRGVAYLELFADGDACEGDTAWPAPRPARDYRRLLRAAGLRAAGLQLYADAETFATLSALERPGSARRADAPF